MSPADFAPSEQRDSDALLSPVHLMRMVDHSVPMRLPPSHFPELDRIAGPPRTNNVSNTGFDLQTGRFFHGGDLDESLQLSPFSSHYSFGPLPTLKLDSTGRVMGIPKQPNALADSACSGLSGAGPGTDESLLTMTGIENSKSLVCPQDRMQTLSMTGIPPVSNLAPLSLHFDAADHPQAEVHHLEDFNEHQVSFATPRHARMLSEALEQAWQMQSPPAATAVPGSAPPALYRSTAEQREVEAQTALDRINADPVSADDLQAVQIVGSQEGI